MKLTGPVRRPSVGSLLLALALLVAVPCAPALGQMREAATVEAATVAFHEIMRIPESGIPPALLSGSHAIAIVPNVLKASFLVGGRFGRGVVVVRDASGHWSNPIFVTLGGGSFGFQAGAQATDLVLVFRNRRSLDGFLAGRGKFTIGADASAAAGPIGRTLSAGTDVRLASEILTYSRSRGLFAGVSLDGSALALDWQANVAYYGKVIGPGEILAGADVPVPASAAKLKAWLNHYTGPGEPTPKPPSVVPGDDPPAVIDPPSSGAPPTDPRVIPGSPVTPIDPPTVIEPSASAAETTRPVVLRSTPTRPGGVMDPSTGQQLSAGTAPTGAWHRPVPSADAQVQPAATPRR
jgi:lipid-binding SYLF domain-containing protein